MVPHRGTNWAAPWLTSQIGRDAVLSRSYGRGYLARFPVTYKDPGRKHSGNVCLFGIGPRRSTAHSVRGWVSPVLGNNSASPSIGVTYLTTTETMEDNRKKIADENT